eukprot:CAMPEP_0119096210 /NCGR_PEP_ID=MMETSP1178-20130426/172109_1 /TAXON_ID=33656 /ORGANISM="unid sp, Strain CCMP2000" /LENGTH=92 /DNA_ID=CAMNT_0007080071 /DNA_START=135 /DNA_END=413 /DNA_ORIENTATION=+
MAFATSIAIAVAPSSAHGSVQLALDGWGLRAAGKPANQRLVSSSTGVGQKGGGRVPCSAVVGVRSWTAAAFSTSTSCSFAFSSSSFSSLGGG